MAYDSANRSRGAGFLVFGERGAAPQLLLHVLVSHEPGPSYTGHSIVGLVELTSAQASFKALPDIDAS